VNLTLVGVFWFALVIGLLGLATFMAITGVPPTEWLRRKEKRMRIYLEVKDPKAPKTFDINSSYDCIRISMDRAIATEAPAFLRSLAIQVERELQTALPIQPDVTSAPEPSEESLTTKIRLERIETLLDRIKRVLDLKS
jgi:hypothetical protein